MLTGVSEKLITIVLQGLVHHLFEKDIQHPAYLRSLGDPHALQVITVYREIPETEARVLSVSSSRMPMMLSSSFILSRPASEWADMSAL